MGDGQDQDGNDQQDVDARHRQNGYAVLPRGTPDRPLAVERRRNAHPNSIAGNGVSKTPEMQSEAAHNKNSLKRQTPDETTAPKRRGIHRIWQRRRCSIGSSPLARKVDTIRIQEPERRPERGSSSGSVDMGNPNADQETSEPPNEASHRIRGDALAHDTDPAQIVKLALSLSESRKRQFSGGNYLSGVDPGSGRRITSFGSYSSGPNHSAASGVLRQSMQQQRQGSVSPLLERGQGSRRMVSSTSTKDPVNHRRTSRLVSPAVEDAPFNPSEATLARAEKAKESFELMYEYRRLLNQLPEATVSAPAKNAGRRGSRKSITQDDILFGRDYNPLQYIRNRKLRLRERNGINAEAEGWRDVERVRAWVNQICQDHEDDVSPVDKEHPLPLWEEDYAELPPSSGRHATDTTPSRAAKVPKIARPYNDWTLDPWSLLADAYWRYQSDNLYRLEGPTGQRLIDKASHRGRASQLEAELLRRQDHQINSISSGQRGREYEEQFKRLSERQKKRGGTTTYDHISDTSDRARTSRWARNLISAQEPSLSEDSDPESLRKSRPKHYTEREHLDSVALERQMMDMLKQEDKETRRSNTKVPQTASAKVPEVVTPPQRVSPTSDLSPTSSSPRPRPQRLQTDLPFLRKQFSPPRSSLDGVALSHRRMSSDAAVPSTRGSYDSAWNIDAVPQIAIENSPPVSPTKATSKKASSRLNPFRRAENDHENISAHDFAAPGSHHKIEPPETKTAGKNENYPQTSADDANGFIFPAKPGHDQPSDKIQNSYSRKHAKEGSETESKIRHFLKPSKVVDMVSTQVSKAGDALWRKDRGRNGHASTLSSGSHPFDSNEGDDADISGLDSSPNDLSRATTNNDTNSYLSRFNSRADRSRYHIENLPSFRSHFAEQRDRSPKSPTTTQDVNPIATRLDGQRDRGRSSKSDHLAPPGSARHSASPSPSPFAGRSPSRTAIDDKSRDSSSTSRARNRLASHDLLNDMLGIPGQTGLITYNPTPTGLSSIEARGPVPAPSKLQIGQSPWSIHDRNEMPTFHNITPRDIARIRILLLTSGVKANEIARRANCQPLKPSPFLKAAEPLLKAPIPQVPRIQEHVTTARLLLPVIESTFTNLNDLSDTFATQTISTLTSHLSGIETRVNDTLTPLVSNCADEADAFSAELSTKHGLAYRQLSDKVDLVLRRRRRRSRWVGRGMWTTLEWIVLGTMWAVWFVVVIVRLIRGLGSAMLAILRWLFWL